MDKTNDAFVIGWDFSKNNMRDVLVVMQGGRDNKMKVINAFYDKDAHDIYRRLTGKKEDPEVSNL